MATSISRRSVVMTLCDMLGNGATTEKVAQILAAYLVQNRIMRESDLYVRDLRRELLNRFGLASVEVKSAHKLTKDVSAQIERFIKEQSGSSDVEIMSSIDNSLLTGVIISTTDSELDTSLKEKIKKLRMV